MNKIPLYLNICSYSLLMFCLTLTGCKDDATGPGPTGKINVSGKVIDRLGNGIISATVSIGDSVKITDANGSFSIIDVISPYDAKIIASGNTGFVYVGLTTTSPQLLALVIPTTINSAHLNVTIPALNANQRATVIFTNQTFIQNDDVSIFPETVANLFVRWSGSTSISGKIIVLVYTLVGGNITTYDKYGEKSGFILNNGGIQSVTFTAAELTLNPGESTISGALILPAGFVTSSNSLGVRYIATASNFLYSFLDIVNTAAFNFVVPTGLPTAAQFVILGSASSPTGQYSSRGVTATAPSAGLNILLETPPNITTPPDAAANIDTSTNFTYTSGSGTGIYQVTFFTGLNSFFVFTPSNTTNIPNLNSLGLGIGSSRMYSWSVAKHNNIISTDAFVSYPFFLNPLHSSYSRSEIRTFTSAP